ncbi:MAG: phosphatase PAP2 family protein [Ferruginibacter sp.]
MGKFIYLFFVWAFLICYARVYVGRHYPLDVIGGGIVGMLIGAFTAWLLKRSTGFTSKLPASTAEYPNPEARSGTITKGKNH